MDFLVISNNKLKIKMNKREQKRYAMNVPEEEYNSSELRTALWRVLDVARAECGFSVVGDRLLVQIYSSEVGCEIFVTKLGRLPQTAERNIARSEGVTMLSSRNNLYRFSDVQTLLSALTHIPADARVRCSDAYVAEDGASYLLVEERTGAVPISDISVLSEFGTLAPMTLLPHLCEHTSHIHPSSLFDVIS